MSQGPNYYGPSGSAPGDGWYALGAILFGIAVFALVIAMLPLLPIFGIIWFLCMGGESR